MAAEPILEALITRLTNTIIDRDEGGWKVVIDPTDTGGVTYAGVPYANFVRWCVATQAERPSVSGFQAAATARSPLLDAQIMLYYRQEFWDQLHFDEFPITRIGQLGPAYYSAAINCGVHTAIMCLQTALGVYADGLFGASTRKTLHDFPPDNLVGEFKAAWRQYYARLVMTNIEAWDSYWNSGIKQPKPVNKRWKFLAGWLARVEQA